MATESNHARANASQHASPLSGFQDAVSECLIRHRSILDVISKFQEANARVNRAVVKSVTSCGCVEVNACRQQCPSDVTYWDLRHHMATHVRGDLCEHCRDAFEQEMGQTLFYAAALCDLLGLDLEKLVDAEHRRIATLGVFNLT